MQTDLELIDRYQKHSDQQVIGLLFERYGHLVFGLCMKILSDPDAAKEAVSQIFEKLFDTLKTAEIRHFPAWIHQVAKNHCLHTLKKKKQYSQPIEQDFVSQDGFLTWEKTTEECRAEALPQAIEQLTENQKICIELFYLRELSYKEIQQQTGWSFAEVKSHIQNGKRNLKLILTHKKTRSL